MSDFERAVTMAMEAMSRGERDYFTHGNGLGSTQNAAIGDWRLIGSHGSAEGKIHSVTQIKSKRLNGDLATIRT
ncbi:MAG TPA: hypothetical protein VH227_03980 [Candidatus Udaeobacter sp.]|nr:hypothetical protein [Candidatus Udaeobacter sp.]